ncbi:protein of unknown function DUF547 [Dillenia turbinata]|uniref:Ternary complex factor MIP1 leucine-zipper domain-containing protein n=1 Tax=Dillenia turbinata TaxID=194707 RepID=A0AAN8ZRN8_9MAGN
MNGFGVDENAEAKGKTQNGKSRVVSSSHVQNHHRRSKSASERNLDVPRHGAPHCSQRDQNEAYDLTPTRWTCRARSPLNENHPSMSINTSLNNRASLEKDIEQLQIRLQQEKSMRIMLERAMGRASSTLSPGHRHFASQTKELIAEIELLEEEVANREQHVLSLYRSIFDNCVSRPPSEQCSGLSSPAHTKNEGRKHPSIISSAFCSSKKFPLQPLQALVSIKDSGRSTFMLHSKTRHVSLLNGKANTQFEKTCSVPNKVLGEKTPVLRTLKDHLYQCPSKLSEEMVRCMAAVYCWLRHAASSNPGKNRSPLLSRSSTNVVLPRRGNKEDIDWSCGSMVEISFITTDKSKFSRASYAINSYSVWNSLQCFEKAGPVSQVQAAYNIGGHIISATAIEYSIFCFHTPRIGRPLVLFALCTGAFSDPVLKVYTSSNIEEELEAAKKEFLQANVVVKKSKKVFLPKVLERYAKEAAIGSDDLLKWVSENVDEKLHDSVQKCIDQPSSRKASQIIEWLPYNSKFRYMLSRDLTEKPWWV